MTLVGSEVLRLASGYRTADGRLVLANAKYTITAVCAGCCRSHLCGWYTGHGPAIRWYCDACAGTACGAGTWSDPFWTQADRSGFPVMWARGPEQIIAPAALDRPAAPLDE